MSIQLIKIVESAKVLDGLYNREGLTRRMSYAIAKNITKIGEELNYYNTEKDKLLKKYSLKDDKGNIVFNKDGSVTIDKNKINDWTVEYTELLNFKVDVDFYKFSEEEIFNCECDLTPLEIFALDFMIE